MKTATAYTECRVCGMFELTGERSCCAAGGDWFQKCGNKNDTKFAHTWFEGIKACKELTDVGGV